MKTRLTKIIFATLILLLICVRAVQARQIYVYPQQQLSESILDFVAETAQSHQYPNIQAAIDDACDGDIIYLAQGRFKGEGNRDLDYKGKAITVSGLDPNNPDVVANTIIDCNGTESDMHRGVYFHSGEDTNSVVRGLTIINGYAPNNPYQEGSQTYNYWAGGAIFCYGSSPTISNCHLVNNYASWFGGGLSGRGSNAIISGCLIANNRVACVSDGAPHAGGGIYYDGAMTITNCIIIGNIALSGGGIGCGYYSSIINNCIIAGNIALGGGGIGTISGMGIGSSPKITNCTFSGNIAYIIGGAIYCGESSNPSISNSILWGNSAVSGSEIAMNKIDWGSSLSISYSNLQGGKDGIVNGSNFNCHLNWRLGNIDTDPCFTDLGYWDANGTPDDANDDYWINGDYHLKSQGWRWDKTANQWTWDEVTSRCIDAGSPGYSLGNEPLTLDVDPLNRFGENLRIDMGCYGGTAEASMPPYNWALLSDIDNSGKVDFADYSYLAEFYGQSAEKLDGDLNLDGLVDLEDIWLIVADWLKYTDWALSL